MSYFSVVSTFWWDDDDDAFYVIDQHAKIDFYCAISLQKKQPVLKLKSCSIKTNYTRIRASQSLPLPQKASDILTYTGSNYMNYSLNWENETALYRQWLVIRCLRTIINWPAEVITYFWFYCAIKIVYLPQAKNKKFQWKACNIIFSLIS